MSDRKTIVFDLDGTICPQLTGKNLDYSTLDPFPGAVDAINRLHDSGHRIVIYTARFMGRCHGMIGLIHSEGFYESTVKQLDGWGVKYDKLIMGKSRADLYVDDKGVRFDGDWEKTEDRVRERLDSAG